MTQSIKSYNEAVAFHGHACPGLALGYRAAEYAIDSTSGPAVLKTKTLSRLSRTMPAESMRSR